MKARPATASARHMPYATPATLTIDPDNGLIRCGGDWTVFGLAPLERELARMRLPPDHWVLDSGSITRLDTAGALALQELMARLEGSGTPIALDATLPEHRRLLELVARTATPEPEPPASAPGWIERVGIATIAAGQGTIRFLAFLGAFVLETLPLLARPWRLRGGQVVAEIHKAGVTALPIIGLLTFLMGVVIAYQGGIPLEQYGAKVFLVDLVAITMLREMAPLLTAIVIAGRTGSAYTAEIGTMKITEEIDALRSLGLRPYEVLALPKLLALLIALPLLATFANIIGIFGGALISQLIFGVDHSLFLDRMPNALSNSHFWVGISKTPLFAAIIALVGCYHGFRVEGSAESVGRATTVSVVQGIFLVIVADALFSVIFSMLGL